MYSVTGNSLYNYSSPLDGIYSSISAAISNMPFKILLENADKYTGLDFAGNYLRGAVAENKQNIQRVNSGISLVQTNQDTVSKITGKLDQMKKFAEDAASGSFSAQEVSAMQSQIALLAEEITDLADGKIGETHLLTSDIKSERVFIGSGLSIEIKTHDMTAEGLDIDNLDLTSDPAGAVTAIDAALSEAADYTEYLSIKTDLLESANVTLELQSKILLPTN